jgi:transcriptional regulator with XRE-family HTH domain
VPDVSTIFVPVRVVAFRYWTHVQYNPILAMEGTVMLRLEAPPVVSARRVRAALGISRERMGRLLDVTAKTVARLEERERLPASAAVASRLALIQELVDFGLIVFTPAGLAQFVSTPLPAFRGLAALQLIERGETERVMGTLASLYEGVPS